MTKYITDSNKENKLFDRMDKMQILEKDIEEQFIRSSGKGGQNVNKVSTCVALKHLPTGIIVKCDSERSQNLNRYKARIILIQKIEDLVFKEKSEHRQKIEKIKRQKRKRSKRAKEKILETKRIQSEKKNLRNKSKIIDNIKNI